MIPKKILKQAKINLPRSKSDFPSLKKLRPSVVTARAPKILLQDPKYIPTGYVLKVLYSNKQSYDSDHYACMSNLINSVSLNANCLENHEIKEQMRGKMINWLVEVLTAFECNESTFFLAVILMDTYLKKETVFLKYEDIFLIGVTCLFMASKFEDRTPMSMELIVDKISQHELSIQAIHSKEQRIMELMECRMPELTPLTTIEFAYAEYLHSSNLPKEVIMHIMSLSIFISKMCFFNIEIAGCNYGLIGFCSLLAAVKKMGYDHSNISAWIIERFNIRKDKLQEFTCKIEAMFITFKHAYKDYQNLFVFESKKLTGLIESQ